jgi:succinylarginine dihydrolase
MRQGVEINFDGLIGPTHNYAGLSFGNIASSKNKGGTARPRQAALQGLQKMRLLLSLGIPQGVLLPHPRPHIGMMRALGFKGTRAQVLAQCYRADPVLFANLTSASAMWTANAATLSPSSDTHDGKLHVSPANLSTNLHRALEADFTTCQLKILFADPRYFSVHAPLPGGTYFGDEGAANHGRLCTHHGAPGVELFVYGANPNGRFPARQEKRASQAIIRRHGLADAHAYLAQQSNVAIDAGAFHNDVVSVVNGPVLFTHADAFADQARVYAELQTLFPALQVVEVAAAQVPLADAISSYLFNSQLITLPSGKMALILPAEAQETPSTQRYITALLAAGGPIAQAHFIDVRESMKNGGGPACLRLRVVVSLEEQAALDQRFLLDAHKISALEAVIRQTYPEELTPEGLGEAEFHAQALSAWQAVFETLGLNELMVDDII